MSHCLLVAVNQTLSLCLLISVPVTPQMSWTCQWILMSRHTASVIRSPTARWSAATITTWVSLYYLTISHWLYTWLPANSTPTPLTRPIFTVSSPPPSFATLVYGGTNEAECLLQCPVTSSLSALGLVNGLMPFHFAVSNRVVPFPMCKPDVKTEGTVVLPSVYRREKKEVMRLLYHPMVASSSLLSHVSCWSLRG